MSFCFTRNKSFKSTKMLSSMKIYVPLLWGLCVLFSVDSMTTSRPETSTEILVELNSTTRPASTQAKEQSAILNSTHRLAEVSTAAAPQMTVLPAAATEKSENNKTNSSMDGLVTMRTAAAATTSSKSLGSTAETTAKNEAQPSAAVTTAASKAQHSPAVTTSANKAPNPPQVTTAPGAAQPSHNLTIPDTTTVAADQTHHPSTPGFMTTPATASTVSAGTESVSSPHATSTSPENASAFASTSSLEKSTQAGLNFTRKLRSPTSSTATKTANPTSEKPPHHYPSTAGTSTSAGRSSTSHFNHATSVHVSSSRFPDTAASSSTSAASLNSTSAASNSSAGILDPRGPRRLPVPTTRSTTAITAAPNGVSKSSPTKEAQPCSTRGVATQCLIVIAALAVVATIFAVSTIVLCIKLSARKYKVKRPQQATEMMCISSLLPERNHAYTRQRNPIMNGVLVFPGGGDSDEDGGDNVTLSSFLPDNERYV